MDIIYCPVADKNVGIDDCIITRDVADRLVKPSVLPEGISWNEEQRAKCISCKYHNYGD